MLPLPRSQPRSSVAVELQAISVGARAAQLLDARNEWIVAAVFDRSFYLRSGDAFVCVGNSSIGDGPLNIIVAHLPSISGGAPCAIDITSARIRQVSLSPSSPNERGRESRDLLKTAMGLALPESFIHAIADRFPVSLIHRKARIGIEALRRGDFDVAVTTLAGLGHGLTPSGDDVLAGALLMLHALAKRDQAAALADAVRRIAPTRTSPLSYALLEPACDGEPNEAVATAITTLLAGKPPHDVIAPLATVGATSGFDILCGLLVAAGL